MITLSLSGHRTEALKRVAPVMADHDVVVLEEPPMPGFAEMLAGELAIDDYLETNVFEFPELARRTCDLVRRLHADGVRVVQCEPYLELLASVHDAFEAGQRPEDVENDGVRGRVYQTERSWTGALMEYYWTAPTSPFDQTVSILQEFARQDAARGRLRDRLRAAAIAPLAGSGRRIFVEAGYLHVGLRRELRGALPVDVALVTHLPMESVYRRLCGRPHLLAPGDRLTLRYTFHPAFAGPRADLLAARALIHVKIEGKEELTGNPGDETPHAHDEVETARLVEGLSYADCERLFPLVRTTDTSAAREIVGAAVETSRA